MNVRSVIAFPNSHGRGTAQRERQESCMTAAARRARSVDLAAAVQAPIDGRHERQHQPLEKGMTSGRLKLVALEPIPAICLGIWSPFNERRRAKHAVVTAK